MHSREWRDRIAKRYVDQFHLSRRSVREMYNRGTITPSARSKEDRIPVSQRHGELTESEQNRLRNTIAHRIMGNIIKETLFDTERNRGRIVDNVDRIEPQYLRMAAGKSTSDWSKAASVQDYESAPQWLRNVSWFDEKGKWHNVAWYKG